MNIGFVTNLRAPYRTLQLNEFTKLNHNITAYYTNKKKENRNWETNEVNGFNEVDLRGIKISNIYGYINTGIIKIIKNNDIIILGGYDQPTIIVMAFLCKVLKKPYIIMFDGISCNKISSKENKMKKLIKEKVINNSIAIMANGTVSKRYFSEKFNYSSEKIYNQYLSINNILITDLYKDRDAYRREIRKKYKIKKEEKVLIYSGRLIEIKNVENVIRAIAKINKDDLVFFITGGGVLEEKLKKLAKELNVRIIITGFIYNQMELFKNYFAGDALILPSIDEAWGLVVNEAMASGLAIIVSKNCGCSMDLLYSGENGYEINPVDINDILIAIKKLFYNDNYKEMGLRSKEIIKEWTFENSRKSLKNIISII